MKQGNIVMGFSGNVALTDGGNRIAIVVTTDHIWKDQQPDDIWWDTMILMPSILACKY
jgi:hypothetical protein